MIKNIYKDTVHSGLPVIFPVAPGRMLKQILGGTAMHMGLRIGIEVKRMIYPIVVIGSTIV